METNRANISFGRSIYINLGEQVVTQVLEEMKAARQTVAFTSFQLPEHPLEISDMTRLCGTRSFIRGGFNTRHRP